MDPLTHALLGASSTLLISKPEHKKWALFCGVVAGMLPDLDVLIRSDENPLLTIQYHRHFTHSLFFVPVGALIASGVVWIFARAKVAWSILYRFCLMAYLTHPFLDSATSYGTHLLWPLTNARVAWSIVPIVDPIPTLLLLGGVIAGSLRRSQKIQIGCVFGFLFYLMVGGIQKFFIGNELEEVATSRGHSLEKYDVKPSVLQIFVWRTIYEYQGKLYVDAFQKAPFSPVVHYEGGSLDRYFYETDSRLKVDTAAYQDMEKFDFFSDGYVAQSQEDPLFIGDIRYSLLPHHLKPLWGVRINPSAPEKHLPFENHRQMQENTWEIFMRMIRGLPIRNMDHSPEI